MPRHALALALPTVELSVTATSEELELLSAAALQRRMSLRDFLRVQIMAAAKSAAKAGRMAAGPAKPEPAQGLDKSQNIGFLQPAFLP
ncbi:MAG: hypothetical protein EXR11_08855 [Rhodospirillaceae bacterium]|nr:hypothetical protein [Rhodospirillaceae bacterium]